jgi:hypothetical protein
MSGELPWQGQPPGHKVPPWRQRMILRAQLPSDAPVYQVRKSAGYCRAELGDHHKQPPSRRPRATSKASPAAVIAPSVG